MGNKQNCYLNGCWATRVKGWTKKQTSKVRRRHDKNIIAEQQGRKFFRRGR